MTDTYTISARDDELNLLAACMNGYDPRDTGITAAQFDEPRHAHTWKAMLRVINSGRAIDPATVAAEVGPEIDPIWLFDLFAAPIVPANAPSFAAHIRRAAELRNLQDLARGIMQRATTDMADPAEVSSWARSKLDTPTGAIRDTETFADTLPRVLDQIKSGQQAGLATPWPDLDRRIHGLSPGRLYVIAARPGGGKSLAGQNLAWHWSRRHQLPTYLASLEMDPEEITTRTIAQVGQVRLSNLISGNLEGREPEYVGTAQRLMQDALIHMCTDPRQTIDTIRNGARQLQRRHGLGLVVVDYLQIVRPRDPRMPRREQVDEIARDLKLMAKELQVPVVAMTQLNREGSKDRGRPPVLSDLRESGEIEQAADVVILLHRPDPEVPEEGQMLVAKARNGSTGPVDVLMRTFYASIESTDWKRP